MARYAGIKYETLQQLYLWQLIPAIGKSLLPKFLRTIHSNKGDKNETAMCLAVCLKF